MKRLLLAALIGLAPYGEAGAKDQDGRFITFSVAMDNCSKFLSAYARSNIQDKGDKISYRTDFGVYLGWIAGYASRVNQLETGGANVYNMEIVDIVGWVASWCRDNPEKNLLSGVVALTRKRAPSFVIEDDK